MLDIKRIASDPEGAEVALKRRTPDASFAPILSLNTERREVVSRFNDLRHEQKTTSLGFKDKSLTPEARTELHTTLKASHQAAIERKTSATYLPSGLEVQDPQPLTEHIVLLRLKIIAGDLPPAPDHGVIRFTAAVRGRL